MKLFLCLTLACVVALCDLAPAWATPAVPLAGGTAELAQGVPARRAARRAGRRAGRRVGRRAARRAGRRLGRRLARRRAALAPAVVPARRFIGVDAFGRPLFVR